MKTREPFLAAVAVGALVLAPVTATLAQSAPAKPSASKSAAGAKKPGKNRVPRPVAQLQAVMGKPLTDAQKKAVLAAARERDRAMKPIRDKYQQKVATALGITVAQLDAKEKAWRARQKR
jgi:hypothetical protein